MADKAEKERTASKWSRHRVLIWGLLSPFGALILYVLVYTILTRASSDRQKDWAFRLTLSTLAMVVPHSSPLFSPSGTGDGSRSPRPRKSGCGQSAQMVMADPRR